MEVRSCHEVGSFFLHGMDERGIALNLRSSIFCLGLLQSSVQHIMSRRPTLCVGEVPRPRCRTSAWARADGRIDGLHRAHSLRTRAGWSLVTLPPCYGRVLLSTSPSCKSLDYWRARALPSAVSRGRGQRRKPAMACQRRSRVVTQRSLSLDLAVLVPNKIEIWGGGGDTVTAHLPFQNEGAQRFFRQFS